jgi:hypothetical protein
VDVIDRPKSGKEGHVRMQKVWLVVVAVLCVAGCQGKGEVVNLNLQAAPEKELPKVKGAEGLTVAVGPFEDLRPEQKRLGKRTHLGGGETYFQVPGGNSSEAVARVVSDYLAARGWRVTKGGAPADVMVTGKIQDLAVQAKSRFMGTDLTAKSKLSVQAKNALDGSAVNLIVFGNAEDTEFWFDLEDAQEIINDALNKSLDYLIANTKVEGRMLKLME